MRLPRLFKPRNDVDYEIVTGLRPRNDVDYEIATGLRPRNDEYTQPSFRASVTSVGISFKAVWDCHVGHSPPRNDVDYEIVTGLRPRNDVDYEIATAFQASQ